MSDDEVIASDDPPRYLLDKTTHLYKRSCPSNRLSVRPFIPRIFQTTKNVLSYILMTTKFDMDQERVKDNSKCKKKYFSNEIRGNYMILTPLLSSIIKQTENTGSLSLTANI